MAFPRLVLLSFLFFWSSPAFAFGPEFGSLQVIPMKRPLHEGEGLPPKLTAVFDLACNQTLVKVIRHDVDGPPSGVYKIYVGALVSENLLSSCAMKFSEVKADAGTTFSGRQFEVLPIVPGQQPALPSRKLSKPAEAKFQSVSGGVNVVSEKILPLELMGACRPARKKEPKLDLSYQVSTALGVATRTRPIYSDLCERITSQETVRIYTYLGGESTPIIGTGARNEDGPEPAFPVFSGHVLKKR